LGERVHPIKQLGLSGELAAIHLQRPLRFCR
jgi:hypothetical protein